MYINSFVNITSRAWAIPILASLHNGISGRQAPLLTATGASRTAFSQSMDHLIQSGLIARNPGFGHPLRPEFILTKQGAEAAEIADKIQSVTPLEEHALIRRAWTLPVLATLRNSRRFGEIKQELSLITDRALSQSLALMEQKKWLAREVDLKARPPTPIYLAANTGMKISQAIGIQLPA